MELLPKSTTDFSSKIYWNEFFAKRGNKSFEWYGEYTDLCGYLHKYIRANDKILVPGCGNSTLSADLFKVGIKDLTNVDISEIAISQMKVKYPEMIWLHGDILNLDFEAGTFSCVLDKGTLDALLSDECSEKVLADSVLYFTEMSRLVKIGGRFICISLLQEHILKALMDWFPKNGWIMRFSRCIEAERKKNEKGNFSFPVFIVICTKFKKSESFIPLIELDLEGQMRRVHNFPEVQEFISSLQQFALLKHNLANKAITNEEIKLELCSPESGKVRFCLFIVDCPKSSHSLQFAVFIVPHGRETEWLFSDHKGQLQLAEAANANRLVIVHLMRDQTYGSIKNVQDELSPKVVELSPSNMTKQGKIPFLSIGEDLGERREVYRGRSYYSGEFIVEDVKQESNSYKLRRLIFLNKQNIIQSEAKINLDKKKKGQKKSATYVIDPSYLSCAHHSIMVGALELVSHAATVLLIGLGGGALATFLHDYFPQAQITAVDIDETMLEVATKWFNFKCSKRLKCNVSDGLDFIKNSAREGTKYDIIMFDVDSKDHNEGLSCPPKQFVDKEFLDQLATCISADGLFVLNLVCRDETLKNTLLQDLKNIFPIIISFSIPEDVNNVLFCKLNSRESVGKKYIETNFKNLNKYFKSNTNISEDILDIDNVINNFSVISNK